MNMPKKNDSFWQLLSAMILCLGGLWLLFLSLLLPPRGIIDGSVLVAYGEVSTFAGALIGIDYKYRRKE